MYKKFLLRITISLMLSLITTGNSQAQDGTDADKAKDSSACEKFNAMKKESEKSGNTQDILAAIAGMSTRLLDCVQNCNCAQADCMNNGMAENARLKELPENKGKSEDDYYVPYQIKCSDLNNNCSDACKAKFPGELEGDATRDLPQ